ncbi:MAG: TRAM domain-containing protein, partial [Wenyingzhuangia sp.]
DDVPEKTKKRRLQEVIELQRKMSLNNTEAYLGKTVVALIEGNSKKSDQYWMARNSQNYAIVFPKGENQKPGDFVKVNITDCTSATLLGKYVSHS